MSPKQHKPQKSVTTQHISTQLVKACPFSYLIEVRPSWLQWGHRATTGWGLTATVFADWSAICAGCCTDCAGWSLSSSKDIGDYSWSSVWFQWESYPKLCSLVIYRRKYSVKKCWSFWMKYYLTVFSILFNWMKVWLNLNINNEIDFIENTLLLGSNDGL